MALVNQQPVTAQEPFKGPYGNMKFPAYTFREFPKQVGRDAKGKAVIANDREEEQILLARGDIEVQLSKTDDAEKNLLRAQLAEERGKVSSQAERMLELEKKFERMLGLMEAKTEPLSTQIVDVPADAHAKRRLDAQSKINDILAKSKTKTPIEVDALDELEKQIRADPTALTSEQR